MLEKVKEYAISKHRSVNQKYDDQHYDYHLNMVYEVAKAYIDVIAIEDRESVLAACWVHDIIEDARETYQDVKKNTNKTIADLAYALTNEKGRTRAERANDKYYKGIKETKNASFIKFCDRIANVKYSKKSNLVKFERYKAENDNFMKKIYVSNCKKLRESLIVLFRAE